MVLNLVDTRVVKNSKVEIYSGECLGEQIEAVKIFNRASSVHRFKLKSKLFKAESLDAPFNSFGDLKMYLLSKKK